MDSIEKDFFFWVFFCHNHFVSSVSLFLHILLTVCPTFESLQLRFQIYLDGTLSETLAPNSTCRSFAFLKSRHLKLWKLFKCFSDLAWGDDRRTRTKKSHVFARVCVEGAIFRVRVALILQEIAPWTPQGFQGRSRLRTGCQGKVGINYLVWFSSLVCIFLACWLWVRRWFLVILSVHLFAHFLLTWNQTALRFAKKLAAANTY